MVEQQLKSLIKRYPGMTTKKLSEEMEIDVKLALIKLQRLEGNKEVSCKVENGVLYWYLNYQPFNTKQKDSRQKLDISKNLTKFKPPYLYRGMKFKSREELLNHFNITRATFYRRINKGEIKALG